MTTLTLRPTGDSSVAYWNFTPNPPSGYYSSVDEATEDAGDYCIQSADNAANKVLLNFSPTVAQKKGAIVSVAMSMRANDSLLAGSLAFRSAASAVGAAFALAAADATYTTGAVTVNPVTGVAWTWAELESSGLGWYGSTYSAGNKVYQFWLTVVYIPAFTDAISIVSAGGGIASMTCAINADSQTLAKAQFQVGDAVDFATPIADTGLVDATEIAGASKSMVVAWVPAGAGTYYARFGARAADEATVTWTVAFAFTVTLSTIDTIAIAQSAEHVTVTVNVTDAHSQPPLVTVYVDGQATVAEVTDRTTPGYVYVATMDVSRGSHSLQVQVNNIWAVVTSVLQTFVAAYDLHETSARVYWGDKQIVAWGFQWSDPLLPDVPTCAFDSNEEITGQVQVVLRRRGYEARTYKVTRHSKNGNGWHMECSSIEGPALNKVLDLSVKGATAATLMQQAMGSIAPAADYSTIMPQWFYGQTYKCRASELVDQLLIQSGVIAWLQAGRWAAASIDAPAVALLAWGKAEPEVGYEADDTIYNRVRAHYAIAQYPVPATALTEKDAANWTGTITDAALTDNLLTAPSGAWYMLRANGNVSRTGLSIALAPFDRFKLNWLPETTAGTPTLAIKLKQDASNYLSYTRTFAGAKGSGFIVAGTGPTATALYTVTAAIRPVMIQGYMTQPCSVVVTLKTAGVTVWTQVLQSTQGAENHWMAPVPASIYQAAAIDTIELLFSGLYPVNAGYGVSCTQLLIDQYTQVATVTGSTREITYRANVSCSLPRSSYDIVGSEEQWYFQGIIGKVPVLTGGEAWDLMMLDGSVGVIIYDSSVPAGERSVNMAIGIGPQIVGDDIYVYGGISAPYPSPGQNGDIKNVENRGSAKGIIVKYLVSSTSTLSWIISAYEWASTYNLWDAIDIPLTSFTPTGTTRTITSIEFTCAGINELDSLQLAASNPLDVVVEAVTGAGDILYPDEATGFNSREAAQAWANGMLARVSIARPSYTKVLPMNEDIALGEWIDCDGAMLQVRAISGNMDAGTITVAAGADQQTLNATIQAQSRALDELKRRA